MTCDSPGMTNSDIRSLENEIEKLVREHVAACKAAAAAAVERGFGAATPRPKKAMKRKNAAAANAPIQRRTPQEVAALGERFYAAVCARPGETMRVLSAEVGATADVLHRPMTRLKKAGRLRSVGQRDQTRYFPMASGASSS